MPNGIGAPVAFATWRRTLDLLRKNEGLGKDLLDHVHPLYRPMREDEKELPKIRRGAPTHSLEVVMKEYGLDRQAGRFRMRQSSFLCSQHQYPRPRVPVLLLRCKAVACFDKRDLERDDSRDGPGKLPLCAGPRLEHETGRLPSPYFLSIVASTEKSSMTHCGPPRSRAPTLKQRVLRKIIAISSSSQRDLARLRNGCRS